MKPYQNTHTYWRTNVTQFYNIQKRDLNEIVSALKLTGIVDSLILFFACFQQRKNAILHILMSK